MGGIREVYEKTRKVPDLFWNTYVCRPPAAALVYGLRDTPITPNQITLLAFLVALLSALMIVSAPGYLGLLFAIVLFQLSYVLDCADGMLARLRGLQSAQGHLLDFLMDELKAFLILAAVAVRLYDQNDAPQFLLLGIGGLVCLASGIALTTFQRRPEIAVIGEVTAPSTSVTASPSALRRVLGWVERAAKLLIHYPSYILLAALAGHIEAYFYPYIAVNAVYAARTWLQVAMRFGRA